MALSRQKFREVIFQMLYSYNVSRTQEDEVMALLSKELSIEQPLMLEAQARLHRIIEKQREIDNMIGKASSSYEFDRIQSVECNILRLGVFELLFDSQIPPKVAITEAMRLARKFGTPESATFVNALLDNLYKASIGEQPDAEQLKRAAHSLTERENQAKQYAQEQSVQNAVEEAESPFNAPD